MYKIGEVPSPEIQDGTKDDHIQYIPPILDGTDMDNMGVEEPPTTYDEVFDLALVSIEDYHLNRLYQESPEDFRMVLEGFMIRGLSNFENCRKDLTNRDSVCKNFGVVLSDIEKSIIADYTVIAWLDKEINDVRQITGMMQNNKEAHRYSEANNLNAKINRRNQLLEEVATKKTTYSLQQANWLNKWALK